MIFGDAASFAVELEIATAPFGQFRIWIAGIAVGDFSISSASITLLECFLSYLTLAERDEFGWEAPALFELMKETAFGNKWPTPNSQKFIQYFFAPGYAPFDDWWGIMVPNGSEIRFIFRRNGEQTLNDLRVSREDVTSALEQAKVWIEQHYQLRWTKEGFVK